MNIWGLPQLIQGITWWFIIFVFCKDHLRDYMMINHNAPKPWQWWCCCWRWKWSFYRDTIYLQIGFNTKAGSPGYGFSTCSFPVSFRENNYVLISTFLNLVDFSAMKNEFTLLWIRFRSFWKFWLFLFISQCHPSCCLSDSRWRRIYVKPIPFFPWKKYRPKFINDICET